MIEIRLASLMGERKMRNLSQVSRDSKVSRTTIDVLYSGSSKGINFDTLDKLCRFFNCGVGDILRFKKEGQENG